MKLVVLALTGFLSSPLVDLATAAEPDTERLPSVESDPADSHNTSERGARLTVQAFAATIVTGDRSRQFDSPARSLSELQRAVWLKRRAGQDEDVKFEAALTVNGVQYRFSSPEHARTACRAVIEALRRLAQVRAGLEDLGRIPDAEETSTVDDEQPSSERRTATPEEAMLTIRQRLNEALRKEARRNQGRVPDPQRWQQILAEQMDRARREGLLSEGTVAAPAEPETTAGAALEARRQAEIEAVRRMLSEAFRSGSRAEEQLPATRAQTGSAD